MSPLLFTLVSVVSETSVSSSVLIQGSVVSLVENLLTDLLRPKQLVDSGVVLVPNDVVDVIPSLVRFEVPAVTFSPTSDFGFVESKGPSLSLQVSLEFSHSVLVVSGHVRKMSLVVGLIVSLVELVSLDPDLSVFSGEELIADLVVSPLESESIFFLDELESPCLVLLVVKTEMFDMSLEVVDVD
jgi:hypothetical protein